MWKKRLVILAFLVVAALVIKDLINAWNAPPRPVPVTVEKKEIEISKDCWR